MKETLITVSNLTKKFPKNYKFGAKAGLRKTIRSFFGISTTFSKIKRNEFVALDDISFTVQRGEAVGLIGKNGAGKSTLLKHLSGIYLPDKGEIIINGHIEALIELGAGFHPYLSGRDNIKQRIAILGLGSGESKKLLKDIIEFSELGDFIDMPVKNYSSGMQARLGFASAVLTKPDILLVDEVLSVGDFEFKQKCLAKINEIKKDVAIIFVSHSFQTLRMFCDKGIVLVHGKKVFSGNIDEAIHLYQNKFESNKADGTLEVCHDINIHGKEFLNNDKINSYLFEWCDEELRPKNIFESNEDLYLKIQVSLKRLEGNSYNNLILAIPFWNKDVYVTSLSSDVIKRKINVVEGEIHLVIKIKPTFNLGEFLSCLVIHDGPEYILRKYLPPFKFESKDQRRQGMFRMNYEFFDAGELGKNV